MDVSPHIPDVSESPLLEAKTQLTIKHLRHSYQLIITLVGCQVCDRVLCKSTNSKPVSKMPFV